MEKRTIGRALGPLIAGMLLAGCASGPAGLGTAAPASLPPAGPGEEQVLAAADWGLALSGGGLRSALYTMGVLKALHDQGALPRMKVVSSVSGGGYAAYWLLTSQLADPAGRPLGASVLGQDSFARSMCHRFTRGNFVSNWRYLGILARAGTSAVPVYEASLRRTFGDKDPGLALHQLAASVQQQKIPYWIVNTSVADPKPRRPLTQGVFELTPFFSGSVERGYGPWRDGRSLEVTKSVAISGAAARAFLKQDVVVPRADGSPSALTLSDGGHTENLGAFALIRRRIPNIVIVDAEHDPGLGFGAYRELRDQLRPVGFHLHVPDIETALVASAPRQLARSLSRGVVVSGDKVVTRVYYVKMALPDTIKPLIAASVPMERGARVTNEVFDALKASADANGNWNCDVLDPARIPTAEWLRYNLATYSRWVDESSVVRSVSERLPSLLYGGFPHFTTLDQSFYIDQSLAFVGLGYFQACEMAGHPELRASLKLSACERLDGQQQAASANAR